MKQSTFYYLLRRGVIGGGGRLLPLDQVSPAVAGYSLRKIRKAYTGAAIAVRKTSDSVGTTQNIGFDSNGNLDTAALETYLNGELGLVETWFDQSLNGSTHDLTQTGGAKQPAISDASGNVLTLNGKPYVNFDGGNDRILKGVTGGFGGSDGMTFGIVSQNPTNPGSGTEVGLSFSNSAKAWGLARVDNKIVMSFGTDLEAADGSATTNQEIIIGQQNGSSSFIRKNSTQIASGNAGTNAGNRIAIGRSESPAGSSSDIHCQEVLVYDSVLATSDIVKIENNFNAYYSIY